jgi:hypothetical protein
VARSADFDLASALARPNFTPGARDAGALVELVVAGTEPAAGRATVALAKLGVAGRDAILARLAGEIGEIRPQGGDAPRKSDAGDGRRENKSPKRTNGGVVERAFDEGATARLVGALGLMARAGDAAARAVVIARAADPAVRVRRAAIGALGKLGGDVDDARAVVIARWDASDVTPDERRTLAEALGKLGGDEAMKRLRAATAGDDSELARRRDRAVLMADRSARRDATSEIVADRAPPAPVTVRLACRPGLGVLLVEELAALGMSPRAVGDHAAEIEMVGSWSTLFASRLWATASVRLPFGTASKPARRAVPRADRVEDPDALGAAIVAAIVRPEVRALLAAWTNGPIRWRLGFAKGHKRSIVWRVARDVTAAAPELVNDPTATTWEFVVDDEAGTLDLVPRRLADTRWAWRVAEVPAASHPSVAAALVHVAGVRSGETVWDPFCGSGLELVEAAKRGARVCGSDLDEAALDAARANCKAAGVDATLALSDARVYSPHPVDAIITNPPLGSRVRIDAAALLVDALDNFERQLGPTGRLVWITPAPRKTTPKAESLGMRRTRSLPVDLGGVRGQLERWEKRS